MNTAAAVLTEICYDEDGKLWEERYQFNRLPKAGDILVRNYIEYQVASSRRLSSNPARLLTVVTKTGKVYTT